MAFDAKVTTLLPRHGTSITLDVLPINTRQYHEVLSQAICIALAGSLLDGSAGVYQLHQCHGIQDFQAVSQM